MTTNSKTPFLKLREIISHVTDPDKSGIKGREEPLKLIILALLHGSNILLFGPPGTGKSMICHTIQKTTKLEFFENTLHSSSSLEDVVGSVDIDQLQKGVFKRKLDGMLPDVEFGFLDEIFKASKGVLSALLTILNERTYKNGTEIVDLPLRTVVAASNEIPLESDQGALMDRFNLRVFVDTLPKEQRQQLFDLKYESKTIVLPQRNASSAVEQSKRDLDKVLMHAQKSLAQKMVKKTDVTPENIMKAINDLAAKLDAAATNLASTQQTQTNESRLTIEEFEKLKKAALTKKVKIPQNIQSFIIGDLTAFIAQGFSKQTPPLSEFLDEFASYAVEGGTGLSDRGIVLLSQLLKVVAYTRSDVESTKEGSVSVHESDVFLVSYMFWKTKIQWERLETRVVEFIGDSFLDDCKNGNAEKCTTFLRVVKEHVWLPTRFKDVFRSVTLKSGESEHPVIFVPSDTRDEIYILNYNSKENKYVAYGLAESSGEKQFNTTVAKVDASFSLRGKNLFKWRMEKETKVDGQNQSYTLLQFYNVGSEVEKAANLFAVSDQPLTTFLENKNCYEVVASQ